MVNKRNDIDTGKESTKMKSLVMMYVYYDDMGDIKAISPTPDIAYHNSFNTSTFPLADVDIFLNGLKNPFDYTIKSSVQSGNTSHKIVKKQISVNLTRTLDNYLTKVDESGLGDPIIRILSNPRSNEILLRVSSHFKNMLKNGTIDEQEDVEQFLNCGESILYITEKNNPYAHIHTVNFNPRDLFHAEKLYFKCNEHLDISHSSVYTKKIAKTYGYVIRGF